MKILRVKVLIAMTKLLIPPLSPLLSILILHLLLFLHLSPPFIVWTFSANDNSSSSTSTSASFYLSFFYWLIFLALDLLSRSNGEKLGPATEAALDQTRLIVETAHNIVDSKQVWNIVLLSCWLLILILYHKIIENIVILLQIKDKLCCIVSDHVGRAFSLPRHWGM